MLRLCDCVTAVHRGFASASADKDVKFWDFTVETGGVLGIALARQLTMAQVADAYYLTSFAHTLGCTCPHTLPHLILSI